MKASDSVVLIGAPDSGKTNYVGRLWQALESGKQALRATHQSDDIGYVMDALGHLLQGEFAPRTEKSPDEQRECRVQISWKQQGKERLAELLVPDVSGEIWQEAVETNELPEAWMAKVRRSIGALVFVRVTSPLNRPSLSWVKTAKLLEVSGEADSTPRQEFQVPTDVELCEFLRFLEFALGKDAGAVRPRVAVLVAAWDLLDEDKAKRGPTAYLREEFPLFGSQLAYTSTLEIKVFGLSVVDGDFSDLKFKTSFLSGEIDDFGYVVTESGDTLRDVTTPLRWVLDGKAGR